MWTFPRDVFITERGGISAARKRDQAAQAAGRRDGAGKGGSRALDERIASSGGGDPTAPGEDAE
jgi:hypothetical protein